MNDLKSKDFLDGVKAGVPVCLGYFSVSFGFGAMAIAEGLKLWHAALISITNLTSAGQFAGLTVIVTGATILEMILTQLVINSRYALMSLALGQRLGPQAGTGKRLLASFFNTDEVFALGMARKNVTTSFFVGAGTISAVGWTAGTVMGAVAGSLLPLTLRSALGVMLYGMFIAIVVPQVKKEKTLLLGVALALVLSCLFAWLPLLQQQVSGGLAIVICTVIAAAVCALVFPVEEEEAAQ